MYTTIKTMNTTKTIAMFIMSYLSNILKHIFVNKGKMNISRFYFYAASSGISRKKTSIWQHLPTFLDTPPPPPPSLFCFSMMSDILKNTFLGGSTVSLVLQQFSN